MYNLRNIRTLFIEGFSEEELRDFCFDNPQFRPVYNQFPRNGGKTEIVRQLIDYAEQKVLLEALLVWAKEHNPTRYEQHQPYYIQFTLPKRQRSLRDFRRWLRRE